MANVLIVDDEPAIVFLLKEALADRGHAVSTAGNGLAGLELLNNKPVPDVVLMDLKMPKMNGRAAIDCMRRSERLRNIPVVVLSGSFPYADEYPLEEGYNAFFYKPFDLFAVVEAVESLAEKDERVAL